MEADLSFSVLGPLAVERAGVPVAIASPSVRLLVVRLLLDPGRVVAADRLIDDLWDGDPPRTAWNTLQSYVSLLRRALGDTAKAVVVRDGNGYRLAVDPGQVDAVRFERMAADGRAVLGSDPRAALGRLDGALALWRGAALGSAADHDFARPHALHLEELRSAAIEDRFEARLALGDEAATIGEIERRLAAMPLRERLAGQLMRALYRAGRQAEALEVYNRTRRRLADDLGLDPTPELSDLERAILDHDPALLGVAAAPEAPGGPARASVGTDAAVAPDAPPVPVVLPLPALAEQRERTPFIGRAAERAELGEQWRAATEGRRRLVLLAGEPGMGKTRLAATLANDVAAEGGFVLWGRCTPELLVPYQPVVEALRTALAALPVTLVQALVRDRPSLAVLLPDLVEAVGEVDAPLRAAPETERYLLFEAVTSLLAAAARVAPVLVVIDDVHWADPPTLALFEHLLRGTDAAALLVVATMRTTDAEQNRPLEDLLADLRRDRKVTRLAVSGLDADDVASLVEAAGGDPVATGADELRELTGGNPFFVEELAPTLARRAGRDGATALPESIRSVLDRRIERSGDETARVLGIAAVAGQEVDLGVLAAVAGLSVDDALDVTEEAIAAGLLVETPTLGRYGFPHGLVHAALLDRPSRGRRARIHVAVADALERGPGTTGSNRGEVASHLVAAGPLAPVERTVDAVCEAGEQALRQLAYEQAGSWADKALHLLDGTGDDARRGRALLLSGHAQRCQGLGAEGRATFEQAAGLARRTGDGVLLGDAALGAAITTAGIGFEFGGVDEALVTLLHQALAATVDDRPRRARLLAWLARASTFAADQAARDAAADEAVALADGVGDDELSADALLAWRLACWRPDNLGRREEVVRRAVELARSANDVGLELQGRICAFPDALEAADLGRAGAAVEALSDLADRIGQDMWRAYPRSTRAAMATLAGDAAAAEVHSLAAYEAAMSTHGATAFLTRLSQQVFLARDTGGLEEFIDALRFGAEAMPQMPAWRSTLAVALAETGDLDGARAAWQPLSGAAVAELPVDSLWYLLVAGIADVTAVLDDRPTAEALVPLLEPNVGRLAVIGLGGVCCGSLTRSLALVTAVTGANQEAEALLVRARAEHEELGARPWLARTVADQAWLCARTGDDVRAAGLADEAAAMVDELGMSEPLSLRYGVPAGRRRPARAPA